MTKPKEVVIAWITAFSAVVVAIVGIAPKFWQSSAEAPLPSVPVTVRVFDERSNTGIESASVTLAAGAETESSRTDSFGKHTFQVKPTLIGKIARIDARKDGFLPREIEIAVSRDGDSKEVYLPQVAAQAAITTTLAAVPATSTSPQPSTTTDIATSTTATSSTTTGPDVVTETFRSGPQLSGVGREFSDWYSVCTPLLPLGSKVYNVSYRLEGDRSCGAWSDCALTEQTNRHVCFKFRLQGHSEAFPPRAFSSEGFLTVTYRRGGG